MARVETHSPLNDVRAAARRLAGSEQDYDELLDLVAGRQFVLLGEASHGTQEFYQVRADITRRLIRDAEFDAVVVEGDWPDVDRIHRFVMCGSRDQTARDALGDFDRFPRWMWRNTEVLHFVEWLRAFNTGRERGQRVGMHGLDLYSLHRSAAAVIQYLETVDPEAAARARERYGCMDHAGDPQGYGHAVAMSIRKSCEDEAVAQLQEILRNRIRQAEVNDTLDEDAQLSAEINARIVRNAEAYYRGMFSSRTSTWNLRDNHMAQVLFALHENISRRKGRPARIVVWAHNSHLGDARATQVSRHGEINLGQLVRERAADKALLVGFTTYTGHVTAARDWGSPAEHRWVRPAVDDSIEKLFQRTKLDRFYLPLGDLSKAKGLRGLVERAIGVIYRPETERQSHYITVALPDQFDAVFHLDETSALEPLDRTDEWNEREPPETWPFGT